MSIVHPPLSHLEWVRRKELFGEGIRKVNNIALFYKYPHLVPKEDPTIDRLDRGSRKRSVSSDPSGIEKAREKREPPGWMPVPMTDREQNLLKLICTRYLMFIDPGFKDFLLCSSENAAKLLQQIGRLLAARDNKRLPVHRAVQIATSSCVRVPKELRDEEPIM
ncbi:hypothetical protein Pmar_PMAR026500 [Perkinsus marinus ATCC 50983]|uniref:Uncharacterized protein n=1 Tax=Perkinsus marinus (strain ATCC 50983 / TXsc) TaxID=423536 RepID=C5LDQ2_PERM5|nr:hypothetical protein Pmar_PMAR026500 [Perkinsus marinus ATCC 50983]EER05066.1 hypothetical protein Pmar_PMAR026500 [Perkinsus marinus ATCC 50983]|eukprot:XP_002773250.1 hypothetical protein Pmar_PMAR026500 [Perkinsus marinus ATCC 50983]